MSNVVRLFDTGEEWKQVFSHDGEYSTLQVYVNNISGELEVVQMNDEGEAIRTCLSLANSLEFNNSLMISLKRFNK